MKLFNATWIHLDAAVFLAQLLHLMHVKQLFHLTAALICSASYFILYTHPSSNRGRWWSNHAMVSWLRKDSCHTARQRLPWWEFTEKLSILLEEWYFFVSIMSLIGSICNRLCVLIATLTLRSDDRIDNSWWWWWWWWWWWSSSSSSSSSSKTEGQGQLVPWILNEIRQWLLLHWLRLVLQDAVI